MPNEAQSKDLAINTTFAPIKPEEECIKCHYKVFLHDSERARSAAKQANAAIFLGCSIEKGFTLTTTIDSTCSRFKQRG